MVQHRSQTLFTRQRLGTNCGNSVKPSGGR
jgi:hypothetical protein